MTKEDIAWVRYCHSGVDFEEEESHDTFKAGYDACLNRVCKWTIKVDKYTGIGWRYPECAKGNMKTLKANGNYCQYCGGKIEVSDD